MKILAIDTSTRAASAAVVEDGRLIGEVYTDFKMTHSERLLSMLDHMLSDTHLSMQDIDLFGCDFGPGSFTGLRIGSATIKALAHAMNKKIIPISSLEVCAYMQSFFTGVICPILDAQQNNVYTAVFDFKGKRLRRLFNDCAVELAEIIKHYPENSDILFCGDAVQKYSEFITEQLGERAKFAPSQAQLPRASAVALLAYERKDIVRHMTYKEFLPNYIRKAQAQINFEIKIAQSSTEATT
jgi:tRNA threonylcarbamoyladenosine biosynthesis protein TsaB